MAFMNGSCEKESIFKKQIPNIFKISVILSSLLLLLRGIYYYEVIIMVVNW